MSNNVRIINNGKVSTPVAVQNEIKNRFAFKENKEVIVEYDFNEQNYGVYQEIGGLKEYLFTLDYDGNEI